VELVSGLQFEVGGRVTRHGQGQVDADVLASPPGSWEAKELGPCRFHVYCEAPAQRDQVCNPIAACILVIARPTHSPGHADGIPNDRDNDLITV
jgi:hypothetical protein